MTTTYPDDMTARLDRGARWTAEADDRADETAAAVLADAYGLHARPGVLRRPLGATR